MELSLARLQLEVVVDSDSTVVEVAAVPHHKDMVEVAADPCGTAVVARSMEVQRK